MQGDNITIQSIHPEAKQMVVVFNIEGTTYPKVLPFLTTQDADLLKKQLQQFARELRAEFDALKAAVQQADANAATPVADSVNALTGQAIPVDETATPAQPANPTGDTTTPPADTTGQTPADTSAPSGDTTTPADQTTQSATPAA